MCLCHASLPLWRLPCDNIFKTVEPHERPRRAEDTIGLCMRKQVISLAGSPEAWVRVSWLRAFIILTIALPFNECGLSDQPSVAVAPPDPSLASHTPQLEFVSE